MYANEEASESSDQHETAPMRENSSLAKFTMELLLSSVSSATIKLVLIEV